MNYCVNIYSYLENLCCFSNDKTQNTEVDNLYLTINENNNKINIDDVNSLLEVKNNEIIKLQNKIKLYQQQFCKINDHEIKSDNILLDIYISGKCEQNSYDNTHFNYTIYQNLDYKIKCCNLSRGLSPQNYPNIRWTLMKELKTNDNIIVKNIIYKKLLEDYINSTNGTNNGYGFFHKMIENIKQIIINDNLLNDIFN